MAERKRKKKKKKNSRNPIKHPLRGSLIRLDEILVNRGSDFDIRGLNFAYANTKFRMYIG